jgi:hypothetical protein
MLDDAWSPFVCLLDRGPRDPGPPPPRPPRAVLLPRAGRDCTSDMYVVVGGLYVSRPLGTAVV